AQYPTIAPPAVSISATYPGADAQTVQDTVTQVIEQNMNGIDKPLIRLIMARTQAKIGRLIKKFAMYGYLIAPFSLQEHR
ncbi:efflux RND transporter permease subunit, partial [Salmonella enterica subsp. enterica serovar Mbandaka]|nr:efflux RND transporter permease subunit [Salmonella enterica subsp. enterica serovar Mbandaka]